MFYIGNVCIKNRVCIAPMAGVTDLPYRMILKEFGASLLCTELVSAKAYCYENKGTKELMMTDKSESPIALQIFGNDPYYMSKVVESEIDNYDIIDINMGCPVPKVVRNGEGSALMKEPRLAHEIVKSLVKVSNNKLPITCKIRIGFDNNNINAVEFAKILEDAGASCITVHGRTRTEMYKNVIHLDVIKKVKEAVSIPIIANGNIFSIYDAKSTLDITKADGIALARGIKGNPWFVRQCIEYIENGKIIEKPTFGEIKNIMLKLIENEVSFRGEYRAINELKSHLCSFLHGAQNSAKFRENINKADSKSQLISIIDDFFIDKI